MQYTQALLKIYNNAPRAESYPMPDAFGFEKSVDFDLAQQLHNASLKHPVLFKNLQKGYQLVQNTKESGINEQNKQAIINYHGTIDFLKKYLSHTRPSNMEYSFASRVTYAIDELEHELCALKKIALETDLSWSDEKEIPPDKEITISMNLLNAALNNHVKKYKTENQQLKNELAVLQDKLTAMQTRTDELTEENHTLKQAQSEQQPPEFRIFQRFNGG